MRYKLVKTDIIDPEIGSSEWEKANEAYVSVNRWQEYTKAPTTTVKLLRGPHGISVLMHTDERELRAVCDKQNGDVYLDSCMEFFFKPDNLDTRYFNFELNPKGIMHLGLGDGRHGRTLMDTDRAAFSIVSDAKEGDWTLKFYIPDSFILSVFGQISPICNGNFYKCGDGTGHMHFGAWAEVEVPAPDFHQPDFFGKLEM